MTTIATATLPKNVQYPQYDRSQLRSRIVHFGFGAFHRAHQALLTDRVLNNVGGDWGICEISLFSGDTLMSQLREQDHLFTVLEKGADGNQPIVIGAVHECLNARLDSLAAIIEKFCEPQVAIVSLTITEKGYCIDPATGKLDPTHPRIIHDLENPTLPQSAPGILVEALARRRERGLPPFTVLSCDNIPDNGHVVKNAVLGMAEKRSPALADWIADNVSFPGTMVDRIVPAATPESLAEIAAVLGVDDPCAISCEPFIQWVVEDHFVAGRPAWETAGVQMTDDVLLRYFSDVADAVSVPCLVYNAPQYAGGVGLSPKLIRRCADHPNIVGVKDSSTGNMESILFAVKDKPDFTVMSGSVNNFFTAMTMGGAGGVLSLANSFPEITVELYGLLVNKQYADAIALNTHLLEINRAIGGAGGVAAVKAAMDMNGLAGGDPRLPLLPLTAEQKEALKAKLKGFGLLN